MKHIALLNAFPIDFWKPWGRIINSLNVNNKFYTIKINLTTSDLIEKWRADWKNFLVLRFSFLTNRKFRKILWLNKSFQYSYVIDNWKFRYFCKQKIPLYQDSNQTFSFKYYHSTYLYISLYENKQENFNEEKKEKANQIG